MEFRPTYSADLDVALVTVQDFWLSVDLASLFLHAHEEFFAFFLLLDFSERFEDVVEVLLVHKVFVLAGSTVVLITVHTDVFRFGCDLHLLAWVAVRLLHNTFSIRFLPYKFLKMLDLVSQLGKAAAFEALYRFVNSFHSSGDFGAFEHIVKTGEAYIVHA